MTWEQIVAVSAASVNLFCFVRATRWFRGSRDATPAKTRLTISAYVCAFVQIGVIVCSRPGPAFVWAGLGVYLLAHGVFWWARAAHGKQRPAFAGLGVRPTFLTQTGPYRLVRHPIYTAYLILWVAGAVISARPWLLLTAAWMGCLHYVVASQEERSFADTDLAGDYRSYQDRTGMFFPNPLKWFGRHAAGGAGN
jgi:protein-S-isoprenylcysteine O-methyltransferase Ste14